MKNVINYNGFIDPKIFADYINLIIKKVIMKVIISVLLNNLAVDNITTL